MPSDSARSLAAQRLLFEPNPLLARLADHEIEALVAAEGEGVLRDAAEALCVELEPAAARSLANLGFAPPVVHSYQSAQMAETLRHLPPGTGTRPCRQRRLPAALTGGARALKDTPRPSSSRCRAYR